MHWSSAVRGLAFVLAFSAYAAEQKPAQDFEAVAPPELVLQAPDLDKQTPGEPPPPTPAEPSPEWWGELQQGLDKELSRTSTEASGGSAAESTASQNSSDAGRSTGMSMLRGIAAMCIVVALILVCYYLLNRYGKKSPLFAGSCLGQILGRLRLSPKAELYFVRVKDRVLVVGVTPNEVSRVAEFDAAVFEEAPQKTQAPERPADDGAVRLRKRAAESDVTRADINAVSDELAALKADLDKARQYFSGDLR